MVSRNRASSILPALKEPTPLILMSWSQTACAICCRAICSTESNTCPVHLTSAKSAISMPWHEESSPRFCLDRENNAPVALRGIVDQQQSTSNSQIRQFAGNLVANVFFPPLLPPFSPRLYTPGVLTLPSFAPISPNVTRHERRANPPQ